MLSCLVLLYTQRPKGNFKAIIKSIFKTNLPLLLADSFSLYFWESFWNLQKLAKIRAKMKYICNKFINHQNKKCLLFRCRHAVVIMQTLNWTNQWPAIHDSPPYFWDQWGWPPTDTSLASHARDHWWTLDFANAFVSPGVNSRGELVPSHGATRRRLGDKYCPIQI
jgi:hypothetical protein